MLSITNVGSAQAGNYFKKDDYYLEEGGVWQGKGAIELGLFGAVEKEEFKAVLNGRDVEGNQLVEKKPADLLKGMDRAGVDLTFSAPKSVSILAIADSSMKSIHDRAVGHTLDYIEKNNMQTREQKDGVREVFKTGNMVCAKFDHLISRELDPQLHTHCVVMNMTQKENGEFRAAHNDSLYKDKMDLGRIYRNELAKELLGSGYQIEITDHKQSFFEVKGVDKDLLKAFSKRRAQVLERFEELRNSGKYLTLSDAELKEIAALDSRKIKPEHLEKGKLKEDWERVIKENGLTLSKIKETVLSHAKNQEREPFLTKEALIERAAAVKTSTEAVFEKTEIIAEAVKHGLGAYNTDELEKTFNHIKEKGTLVDLGMRAGISRYSTLEMQDMEKEIVRMVNASKGQYQPLIFENRLNDFMDREEKTQGFSFTGGQREAAAAILTSRDRVNIIQGDAGTGKTAFLNIVKKAMDQSGGSVLGIGFTGRSAAEMEGVGIASLTIDSLLGRDIEFVNPGRPLPPLKDRLKGQPTDRVMPEEAKEKRVVFQIERGSTLIMDEASMTGNRHFHKLLKVAEKGNLKLVIQGDKKQLSSISAGRMHDVLQEKTDVKKVELTQMLRQKQGSEAFHSVQAFQKNGMDQALQTLYDQGNLVEMNFRLKRYEAVRDAALSVMEKGSWLVVTDKNKDREALNHMIREKLIEKGVVNGEGRGFMVRSSANISPDLSRSADAYKVGHVVVVTGYINRNVKAGSEWTVKEVDPDKNVLTLSDGTRARRINAGANGHKLSAFEMDRKAFSKGDQVVFLKNDRKLGVTNGTMGKIIRMNDQGSVTVAVGEGDKKRPVTFNLKGKGNTPKYDYIDHSYAVTVHKSQGMTVDRCIVHHDASDGMATQNSIYVGITRAREQTRIFSSNFDQAGFSLKKQAKEWHIKTSALEEYERKGVDQDIGPKLEEYRSVRPKIEKLMQEEEDKVRDKTKSSEKQQEKESKTIDRELER